MESVLYPASDAGPQVYSERPAVSHVYEIAGRFLLFEARSGVFPAGLDRLLAGFYFAPITKPAPFSPDAIINFQSGDFTTSIDSNFDRFEISGGAHCYTDQNTYLFDFGSWRVAVHPYPSRRVDILMKQELNLGRPEHVQVFNYAISAALRRCELYELHSAAVIDPRNQKGVLFVGPSGSGKSTLTLQLAAGGWQYLTDDILLISEVGESVDARPLRRAFAVTEASITASGHPGLREAVTTLDRFDASKKRFAPRDFFPGAFASSCTPGAIFFVTVTHKEDTVVNKLSRSEAMIKLVKMCPWACYDQGTGSEHLRILAALARQCAAFELHAGQDTFGDPSLTSRLILAQSYAPN